MNTQVCKYCNQEKSIYSFVTRNKCRACKLAYMKAYRDNHKEPAATYAKAYWEANKAKLYQQNRNNYLKIPQDSRNRYSNEYYHKTKVCRGLVGKPKRTRQSRTVYLARRRERHK